MDKFGAVSFIIFLARSLNVRLRHRLFRRLDSLLGLGLLLGLFIDCYLRARNIYAHTAQVCVDLGDGLDKSFVLVSRQRDSLVSVRQYVASLAATSSAYLLAWQEFTILLIVFSDIDKLLAFEFGDLDSSGVPARGKLGKASTSGDHLGASSC